MTYKQERARCKIRNVSLRGPARGRGNPFKEVRIPTPRLFAFAKSAHWLGMTGWIVFCNAPFSCRFHFKNAVRLSR